MSNAATASSRNRILKLLDDNSFVEIGSYIKARNTDFNLHALEAAGDGVVTGYGTIDGILVYVYSQDSSVLGGAIGEMHARKILRVMEMAVQMGAPVIGLLDSAGLRLQEASDALDAFGRIYQAQTAASGVIPQISAIFGTCGGGLAVAAQLSDFVFMEKDARLFVNSPNALAGSDEKKLDTSSALYQTEQAGNVDFVGTEDEILDGIRMLVPALPSNNEDEAPTEDCEDDLNRETPELEQVKGDAISTLIALSDDGFFFEAGRKYGPAITTAFIKLNGTTVGAVANHTAEYDEEGAKSWEHEPVLCPKQAEKAARFVRFCDAFGIPLLTLVNTEGFARAHETAERRIAGAAARLTAAYAGSDVPRVTLITGKALGSAGLMMDSKSLGADIVYAWPDAEIGTMPTESAVRILYADELEKAEDKAAFLAEKTTEYREKCSSAQGAAARGLVDDIITPAETRKRLIAAFEMLYSKCGDQPARKHGTV